MPVMGGISCPREAEKADALSQLAGAVAHELNNIFTAVIGNLHLLEQSFAQDGMQSLIWSDVLQTADRGIELSQNLQAFAGRQCLRRRHADLNRITADCIAGIGRDVLGDTAVQMELWQHPLPVIVDEGLCCAALRELVKNASTAMNNAGAVKIISSPAKFAANDLAGQPAGWYARLAIRDHGVGMTPAMAAHAMEPFVTSKPLNAKSGWGLSRASGFARQCRGGLVIRTELGIGTTVELYLPLVAASGSPGAGAR